MSDRGSPPRPTRAASNVRGLPGIPDRKSSDNLDLVLAQEQHERRERELLAKLAEEQQARVDAERKAAETERRAQHAPARNDSIAPKVEAGAFDIRGRLTLAQFLTTVAGIGGLVASAITYFKTETPAPQIVDNSAPIQTLQAQVSTQAQRIQTLAKHVKELEDWAAIAIEASCVDVVRPEGSRALPSALVNAGNTKRKCPIVRLENPQPVLPGTLDDAIPSPAAQP